MIDRKTLWFLILLILAMTAAAIWRLSLLPDWTQVTFIGDDGRPHTKSGLFLFLGPLSLLFAAMLVLATRRLVTGSDEAIRAYQRSNRLVLWGTGVASALMQAFMIGRSLGLGINLSGETLARFVIGSTSVLIIMHGNNLPKLPWISSRFAAFQLDPWQSARLKRFSAWMSIAYGLGMIAATVLVPMRVLPPLVLVLCPVYLGAIIWNALRLKREPSPMP
jgi:hypothetical protein